MKRLQPTKSTIFRQQPRFQRDLDDYFVKEVALKLWLEQVLELELPRNYLPCLSNGVLLCHAMLALRERSIPLVNVPPEHLASIALLVDEDRQWGDNIHLAEYVPTINSPDSAPAAAPPPVAAAASSSILLSRNGHAAKADSLTASASELEIRMRPRQHSAWDALTSSAGPAYTTTAPAWDMALEASDSHLDITRSDGIVSHTLQLESSDSGQGVFPFYLIKNNICFFIAACEEELHFRKYVDDPPLRHTRTHAHTHTARDREIESVWCER